MKEILLSNSCLPGKSNLSKAFAGVWLTQATPLNFSGLPSLDEGCKRSQAFLLSKQPFRVCFAAKGSDQSFAAEKGHRMLLLYPRIGKSEELLDKVCVGSAWADLVVGPPGK